MKKSLEIIKLEENIIKNGWYLSSTEYKYMMLYFTSCKLDFEQNGFFNEDLYKTTLKEIWADIKAVKDEVL